MARSYAARSYAALPRLVTRLLLASCACIIFSAYISEASVAGHNLHRKLLQTETCGDGIGSCGDGLCCSQYNYCGSTPEHCDAGCQTQYGACSGSDNSGGSGGDGDVCGEGIGSCRDGLCCSQYNYCGSTPEHCDAGCQTLYGTCSGSDNSGGGGSGGDGNGGGKSRVVVGYIGARGDPVPSFTEVPQGGKTVYLALSFATEGGDGNFALNSPTFNPSVSSNLSPENAGAAAQNGYSFLLALYGDTYKYSAPSDNGLFVSNAVSSLQSLAQTWSASGIEINVENGLDGSFVDVWCQIATQLKASNPSFIISASPYYGTWDTYKQMWSQCGGSIDWFDYQLYAETDLGNFDVAAAVSKANELASQLGGLDKLTVGFNSNTNQPRGLQQGDFVSALQQLQGVRGVNVWSLEDSKNFYQFSDISAIESAF